MRTGLDTMRALALAGAMGLLPASVAAQAPAPAAPAESQPAPVAPAAPAAPAASPAPAAPTAAAPTPAAPAAVPVVQPVAPPAGFLVGAVVQLQSGGPKMTIVAIADGKAKVQWQQDKSGKVTTGEFPFSALKLVKDEDAAADQDDDEDDDEEDEETKK